jgi:hypothetical protein
MKYIIKIAIFTLALTITACSLKAQTVIYQQTFENMQTPFDGFLLFNGDEGVPADTSLSALEDSAWVIRYNQELSTNVALATSYYSPSVAANDWFITPSIRLGKASKLSFKAAAGLNGSPDSYSVYISTSQQDVSGCLLNLPLADFQGEQTGSFTEHTIDLKEAGFASQDVYIGFRLQMTNGNNNLMIDDIMVTDDSVSSLVSLTFIVNMSVYTNDSIFFPETDSIDIVGNFNNWTENQYMLDSMPGSDSLYSITIPGFTLGQHLEFKFRINCSWVDTLVEFPYGQPNRTWDIEEGKYTYYCYYNDEGDTYSIKEKESIMEGVKVYPNPFTDIIQVEIPRQVTKIVVSSLTGQRISEFSSKRSGNLEMNLSYLKRGTYFLLFYSDKGYLGSRTIIRQ